MGTSENLKKTAVGGAFKAGVIYLKFIMKKFHKILNTSKFTSKDKKCRFGSDNDPKTAGIYFSSRCFSWQCSQPAV